MKINVFLLILCCMLTGCAGMSSFDSDKSQKHLIGRSAGSVKSELGEPRLILTEEPNQVWTYKKDDCAVFVYFDGTQKVRFAEERGKCKEVAFPNSLEEKVDGSKGNA